MSKTLYDFNVVDMHIEFRADYPQDEAIVISTRGCNLNCWYCLNRALCLDADDSRDIPTSSVITYVGKHIGKISTIVITGGEPTLQKDLLPIIKLFKAMDFKVKLETNGTKPDVLLKCLPYLDCVALDIKAAPFNYHKISYGHTQEELVDIRTNVLQSIELLKTFSGMCELSLTLTPDTTMYDIRSIAHLSSDFEKPNRFYLRTYIQVNDKKPPIDLSSFCQIYHVLKDEYNLNVYIA